MSENEPKTYDMTEQESSTGDRFDEAQFYFQNGKLKPEKNMK